MDDPLELLKKVRSKQPQKVAGYKPRTTSSGVPEYDNIYEEKGKQYDVDPDLLIAQGRQESAFKPNARSHKGAQGLSQFMPETAKEFGVNVNDPKSSVDGQARLMRKLLDRTNDLDLSLAGYNSGHNASVERLKRNASEIKETRNYISLVKKNYGDVPAPGQSPMDLLNQVRKVEISPERPQVPYEPDKLWPVGGIKPGGPSVNVGQDQQNEPASSNGQLTPPRVTREYTYPSLTYQAPSPEQAKLRERYNKYIQDLKLEDNDESVKQFNTQLQELHKSNKLQGKSQTLYTPSQVQLQQQVLQQALTQPEDPETQDGVVPDSFSRTVDFSHLPKGVSKQEYLIQALIPEIASKTGLNSADIEEELRLGIKHLKGAEIEDAKWYQFNVTPEMIDSISLRGAKKRETLKGLVASGMELDPKQIAEKYKLDPREFENAITGQDPQYAEEYQQHVANKQKFEDLIVQYKGTSNSPVTIARILAQRDMGWLDPEQAKAAIAKENDVAQRILGNFPGAVKPAKVNTAEQVMAGWTDKETTKADWEAINNIAKQYGSLANYEQEQKELKEKYKYRPLAGPLEFAKRFGIAVPKAIASILKTAGIAQELSLTAPAQAIDSIIGTKLVDLVSAENSIPYKLGKPFGDYFDSLKNKDFNNVALISVVPDALGQIAVQMLAGLATGGATLPTAIGAAMGASAQYEEAGKFTENPNLKLFASVVGAAVAIPDAIAYNRWLKGLNGTEKIGLIDKFMSSLYARFGVKYGSETAEQLTKITTKTWVENLAKGGLFEGTQELSENKVNDLVARWTYDPSKERVKQLWSITDEDKMSFLGGLIGGLGGGAVQTHLEKKSLKELQNYESSVLRFFQLDKENKYRTEANERAAHKIIPYLQKEIEKKGGIPQEIPVQTTAPSLTKKDVKSSIKDQLKLSDETKAQLELNRKLEDNPSKIEISSNPEFKLVNDEIEGEVAPEVPTSDPMQLLETQRAESFNLSRQPKTKYTPPQNQIREETPVGPMVTKPLAKKNVPAAPIKQVQQTEQVTKPKIVSKPVVKPLVPEKVLKPQDIHDQATKLKVDVDSPLFHKISKELVGIAKLDSMSPKQLTKISKAIEAGRFEKAQLPEEKKVAELQKDQEVITAQGTPAYVMGIDPRNTKYVFLENDDGKPSRHLISTVKTKSDPTYFKHIVDLFIKKHSGNPNFHKFFKGSKVVDHQNNPRIFFHGAVDFKGNVFDPAKSLDFGHHFGDVEQANARVSSLRDTGLEAFQKSELIPVVLSIKNPIRLRDEGVWSGREVLHQVKAKGIIDHQEMMQALEGPHKHVEEKTKLLLEKKGYDGIVYTNEYEGEIHKDSYIAFRNEQVRSIFNDGNFGQTGESDILKAPADKAKALGATGTAVQWVNKNEQTIKDWNKYLKDSRALEAPINPNYSSTLNRGLAELSKDVEKIFQEKSSPEALKPIIEVNLTEYLKEDARRAAVAQNPQAEAAVWRYNSDPEGATREIENFIRENRKLTLSEWHQYLTKENPIYAKDPFFKDWVWTDLIKLRDTRPDLPLGLDKAALAAVYADVKESPNSSAFQKLYEKKVTELMLQDAETSEILKVPDGQWIKIPQTDRDHPDFKANVSKVQAVSDKAWCTSQGMAEAYLPMGDFWVLVKNQKSELAVRFNGNAVAEIQGKANNGQIPEEYLPDVKDLVRSGKVELTISSMDQILRAIKESKIKAKIPAYKEDLAKLSKTRVEPVTMLGYSNIRKFGSDQDANLTPHNIQGYIDEAKKVIKESKSSMPPQYFLENREEAELFLKHFDPEYREPRKEKNKEKKKEELDSELEEKNKLSEQEVNALSYLYTNVALIQQEDTGQHYRKNPFNENASSDELKKSYEGYKPILWEKVQKRVNDIFNDNYFTQVVAPGVNKEKIEKELKSLIKDPVNYYETVLSEKQEELNKELEENLQETQQEAADKLGRGLTELINEYGDVIDKFNGYPYGEDEDFIEPNELKTQMEREGKLTLEAEEYLKEYKALYAPYDKIYKENFSKKQEELDKELSEYSSGVNSILKVIKVWGENIGELALRRDNRGEAGRIIQNLDSKSYSAKFAEILTPEEYRELMATKDSPQFKKELTSALKDLYENIRVEKKAELDKELEEDPLSQEIQEAYSLLKDEMAAQLEENNWGFANETAEELVEAIQDSPSVDPDDWFDLWEDTLNEEERNKVLKRINDDIQLLRKEKKAGLDKELDTPLDKAYDWIVENVLFNNDSDILEFYEDVLNAKATGTNEYEQFDATEYVEQFIEEENGDQVRPYYEQKLFNNEDISEFYEKYPFALLWRNLKRDGQKQLIEKLVKELPNLTNQWKEQKKKELDKELEDPRDKLYNKLVEDVTTHYSEYFEESPGDAIDAAINDWSYGAPEFYKQYRELSDDDARQLSDSIEDNAEEILEEKRKEKKAELDKELGDPFDYDAEYNKFTDKYPVDIATTAGDLVHYAGLFPENEYDEGDVSQAEVDKLRSSKGKDINWAYIIPEFKEYFPHYNNWGSYLLDEKRDEIIKAAEEFYDLRAKDLIATFEKNKKELDSELLKAADFERQLQEYEKAKFNREFIAKDFTAKVDKDGNIEVSPKVAVTIARAEAADKKQAPMLFTGGMLRLSQVNFYTAQLGNLIATAPKEWTKRDLAPLVKVYNTLKAQIPNKSALLYVDKSILPHEMQHKLRYVHSGHQERVSNYYEDFDSLYKDLESIQIEAFEEYFSRVYFNNKEYNKLRGTDKEVLHEETFVHLVEGKWNELGLDIDKAAKFIDKTIKAYVDKNGESILKEQGKWIKNAENKKIIEKYLKNRKGTTSVKSQPSGRREGGEESSAGDGKRGEEKPPSEAPSELGSPLTERAYPLNIARHTQLNPEDLHFESRYYTPQARTPVEREAYQWLQDRGISNAYFEVFNQPVNALGVAKRQAVMSYLDAQISEFTRQNNLPRAQAVYDQFVSLVNIIAPEATDWGQAMSQMAQWSYLNPDAVIYTLENQREKAGKKRGSIPLETQEKIRQDAKDIKALDDDILTIQDILRDANSQATRKSLENVLKLKPAAIKTLRKYFGPSKTSTILKAPLTGPQLNRGPDLSQHKSLDLLPKDFPMDALMVLGKEKYLEGKSQEGGMTLTDFKSSVINDMEANHIDPTGAEPYMNSLYLKVRELVRQEHRDVELARAKKRYKTEDTLVAQEKLASEKAIRAAKASLEASNLREAKKPKDKRTALDIAIDNEFGELSDESLENAREDIKLIKDKPAYYKKYVKQGLKPAQITPQYLKMIERFLSIAEELKGARASIKAQKDLAPPGGNRSLSPSEQKDYEKQLFDKRKEKASKISDFNGTVRHLTQRPEGAKGKIADWYLRMNRAGETGLTTALATTSHNLIAQRGTKLLNAFEIAGEVGIGKFEKAIGRSIFSKGKFDSNDAAKISTLIFEELKSSSFPAVRQAVMDKWRGDSTLFESLATVVAHKDRVVQGVLAYNPDLYEEMIGKFTFGDEDLNRKPIDSSYNKLEKGIEYGVRGVERWIHIVASLNALQEKHFRFATFLGVLSADLKARGIDPEMVIKGGKIEMLDRFQLERAVKRALEDTFGEDIPKTTDVGRFISATSNAMKWIPFPLNPLLFRRFLFNSTKFLYEHTPLALAKVVTDKGLNKRDFMKVVSGIGLFTLALQLLATFGSDDDDPLTLTFPGWMVPDFIAEGDKVTLKMAAYNPLSSFLILANIVNRARKGKEPLKNLNEIWKLFGVDTRYPNVAMDWYKSLISVVGSEEQAKYTKFSDISKTVAGRGVAAYLKAFNTLKDIESQFDFEEATLRDYYDEPFVGELKKVLPMSEKMTKFLTGENSLKKEVAATGEVDAKEYTILNQMGFTIIPEKQVGAKFTPAEDYLDNELRLDREKDVKFYKSPQERRATAITAQLYNALDKGISIEKFTERVEYYDNAGTITRKSALRLMNASKYDTPLARQASQATIPMLVEAINYANIGETIILKEFLVKKARSQYKNDSLSQEEMDALIRVFPELATEIN